MFFIFFVQIIHNPQKKQRFLRLEAEIGPFFSFPRRLPSFAGPLKRFELR